MQPRPARLSEKVQAGNCSAWHGYLARILKQPPRSTAGELFAINNRHGLLACEGERLKPNGELCSDAAQCEKLYVLGFTEEQ